MPPPPRRATLADVAARAGVSVMTASYTFGRPERVSPAARARVEAAAAELGYAGPDPRARSLRRGSTLALGVVLGEHLPYAFDDPGAVRFLAGVAEVCAEQGYGMTIVPTSGRADDVERVAEAAVDGFVVWTLADDDPVLDAVDATRQPTVVHGGPDGHGLGVVSVDNRAGARAVGARAFAGAGRPGVLSQPLDRHRRSSIGRVPDLGRVLFPVTRDRLAGYRDAARAAGHEWADVAVAVCSRNDTAEAEELAAAWVASPDRPDAIAAMGDELAAGVLRAARAAGLDVPRDLAVTGWDDLPVAADLGLTTVAQSLREQGAACARAVLGLAPPPAEVPWSVVVRDSTR